MCQLKVPKRRHFFFKICYLRKLITSYVGFILIIKKSIFLVNIKGYNVN